MNNLITEVDILDEAKEAFLTYTEEVLTDRAVPSAEDGLLSVHRKLIWTMEEILKMNSNSKYKKSASIVGSTLASSYFHGDTACYGALCKITQPYLMRYPLVDGDGNFGTQEGNGLEAAQRYTNARPSIYADLLMTDFKKNIVPLKETYNGEYMEPVVLPASFPNAIVNGRETIAIGLSHNSLPHNMTEVCDAIIACLKKGSSLTIDELMEYIKGPDFPLENVVLNSKDIRTAFETGHSATSLKVRGVYRIEKDNIIFDTIPYRTYRNKIKEQINKNIDVLEQYIDDFSDESNVGVNKLVFKVKKGVEPEKAVLKLFLLTDLQTTLSYNMNYIVNGTPKMCSMMDLIDAYIIHQENILIKTAKFDKDKAEKRKHILEGLLKILNNIDKAIKLIKEAENPKDASEKLIKEFKIDETQAKAVLEMKLSRLTKLDRQKIIDEIKEKELAIVNYTKILIDKKYRNDALIEKVTSLKYKYGDARRTKLLNIEIPKKEKEIKSIVPENVVVIVSKMGDIKKIPASSFKVQNKRGRGIKSESDTVLTTISTNTIDNLMIFTSNGQMYKILVDEIPTGTISSKGTHIGNLVQLDNDERVLTVSSLNRDTNAEYVVFVTKNGLIKKTKIEEYTKIKKSTGIVAINLRDGDSLVYVTFLKDEDMILITKNGMSIHFETTEIKPIGRVTAGVRAINLNDSDEVLTGLPLHKETDYLAIFTSKGLAKKCQLSEFPVQGRNGKGLSVYKPTDVTGFLIGAAMVDDNDNIALIGYPNSICISAKEIPLLSRIRNGNLMIKESNITSIVKI